jgi:hypothetical protein
MMTTIVSRICNAAVDSASSLVRTVFRQTIHRMIASVLPSGTTSAIGPRSGVMDRPAIRLKTALIAGLPTPLRGYVVSPDDAAPAAPPTPTAAAPARASVARQEKSKTNASGSTQPTPAFVSETLPMVV